jgi:Spy/CpxP family protein refolding chaperone
MKKRISLAALVLAVAAIAAAPHLMAGPGGHGAHGMMPGGHHGPGFFGHLRHLKGELDLTDAQTDQIKAIFKDVHQQNEQYVEQLHGGLKGAATVLLANPNDLAGAQAVLDQQAAAERIVKTNLLTATSKAVSVLTPEQRTKLAGLMAKHAERHGSGR